MKKCLFLVACVPLFVFVGACELKKSENPLSPSIAGPIPGVEISAPKTLEPATGWQIPGNQQPLTLLLENASSTSPRPLNYLFEVATDAGFTNQVFARDGIEPGEGGRTSVRLPDPLAAGRTYYWRAKAQDGANTGPYSSAADFNIFTPLSFDKPTLISPAGNVLIDSLRPEMVLANAAHAGTPVSPGYTIQMSLSATFGSPFAAWQVGEQPGQTRLVAPVDLPPGQQIFWRAQAFDGGNQGAWSDAQVFRTPVPVVLPPPNPPGGGGGGSACGGSLPINIVECRRSQFGAHMSSSEVVVFLKGVATDLTKAGISGAPFGLLRKSSGSSCGGFACDIMCSGSGTSQKQWDVLGDSDGAQTPAWIGPKVYPDIRVDTCTLP